MPTTAAGAGVHSARRLNIVGAWVGLLSAAGIFVTNGPIGQTVGRAVLADLRDRGREPGPSIRRRDLWRAALQTRRESVPQYPAEQQRGNRC